MQRVLQSPWFLSLLGTLLIVPLLNRPVHIDDPLFLWTARQIVHHPGAFYSLHVNWEGTDRPLWKIFPIPPSCSFFYAAVSPLTRWREGWLHLSLLPFHYFSLLGGYCLARRYCRRPGLCVILMAITPAAWVSATTLMCEIPLLCFWIWATLFWIKAAENSRWFYAVSALLLSLALLTKFTATGLIPLLLVLALLQPVTIRQRLMQVLALLTPVLLLIAYDRWFAHLYGIGALANAAVYSVNSQRILQIPVALRSINTLAFVGGGFLACPLLVPIARWTVRPLLLLSLAVPVAALGLTGALSAPVGWGLSPNPASAAVTPAAFAFNLQLALMLLCGVGLFVVAGINLRRNRNSSRWTQDLFLLLWIIGPYVFAGFLNWSINIRSLLPMLPAVAIVCVRALDPVPALPVGRVIAVLALCAGLGLAVVVGDYQLARIGKAAAGTFSQLQQVNPRARIWFTGHWGFQYYMQARGFSALDTLHPQYHPGDYCIFPSSGFGGIPTASNFKYVNRFTFGSRQWVTTANPAIGSGFYHSDGYKLPFVIGPAPAETFVLVQVTPDSQVRP